MNVFFSPPGWKVLWSADTSSYYFQNIKSEKISWEYPKPEISIEAEPVLNKVEKIPEEKDEDEDNMDLESEDESTTYSNSVEIEEINNNYSTTTNESNSSTPVYNSKKTRELSSGKISHSIKDKKMLKLLEKWKKAENSLTVSEDEEEDKDEKIEKWAEEHMNNVDSNENPNFEPITGNWRERVLKKTKKEISKLKIIVKIIIII